MFFIGEVLKKGWDDAKNNIGLYIPVLLIYLGILLVGSVLLKKMGVIGQVLLLILEVWLSIGLIQISLKRARGEEAEISDLFKGTEHILNFFIANIIYSFIVVVGLVLLIVPGIIWGIKYVMYPYIVVDKKMSAIDALKMSAQITKGNRWDLLAFNFVTSCITILGLLAIGIGLFWAYPTVIVATALVYLKLNENF